jgi:hypothetical protein
MRTLLALALALGCLGPTAGCDLEATSGRPVASPRADPRSNAPRDLCQERDQYGDGLCDPQCLRADPDCTDCGSRARAAVEALVEHAGGAPRHLSVVPVEVPDPSGWQLLEVFGGDTHFVVSTKRSYEQAGSFGELCTVHGLQDARRVEALLDTDDLGASAEAPTTSCVDAVAAAVEALEREHAMSLVGPDGTRAVTEDEDGRPVAHGRSRVVDVELVNRTAGRELLRVHVERDGGWVPADESYLVHARATTHEDSPDECRVFGLQNRTHQRDMR